MCSIGSHTSIQRTDSTARPRPSTYGLYFQFRNASTTLMVFYGVMVSWSGAFLLIWLYAQPWFRHFTVFGVDLRELFQAHTVNLSVAVWVGFLALFGISDDDGVVMGTFLEQEFRETKPATVAEARAATIRAGRRRIRATLMTGTTTLLALIPVLTSTGRGADLMVPMAIPSMGGMTIELLTVLIVPVLYCWLKERRLRTAGAWARGANHLSDPRQAMNQETFAE